MNVLVTGSHGLIGTALVASLVEDGHRVVRLVRAPAAGPRAPAASSAAPPASSPPTSVEVLWDPVQGTLDTGALERAAPVDCVVHLAGAGIGDRRWTPARKAQILSSRTASTALLATAIAGLDPRPGVVVSGSAIGYYGDRGDEILTERARRGAGFLADVCEAWEQAMAPATDAGIRTVLLRTGIVLAAGGGVLAKQLPVLRLGVGGPLGSGRQYQSWISLMDEVGAIRYALDTQAISGPLNATAPEPATNATLTAALGRHLHRPTRIPVPAAVLRLALGAEMASELVLASQRVVPEVLQDHGYVFAHPSLDAAITAVLGR
ncbi:MAG: TIGR01777 family oxidoreductase [Actinomycetota bacterium]|nr:TIGR01777 family oxidoreductase [Actinomycetota bacterium]